LSGKGHEGDFYLAIENDLWLIIRLPSSNALVRLIFEN
jgi:hypothetical protein